MEKIRTGLYQTTITRKKEEILISKNDLEKAVEKIENSINEKEKEPIRDLRGYYFNLERLKRIRKTGYLLLEKYTIPKIASNLNLVNSTIESYISTIIWEIQELNN